MPWLSMCRQKKGESLLATTDVWKVGALVFPFCASVLDGNEILCWGSWWQCERPDSWFCARFPRHERVVDQHFVKLFIIPPREVHGAEWGGVHVIDTWSSILFFTYCGSNGWGKKKDCMSVTQMSPSCQISYPYPQNVETEAKEDNIMNKRKKKKRNHN